MLTSDWNRTSQEMIEELTRLRDAPDPVRLALLNAVLAAITHMSDGAVSPEANPPATSPRTDGDTDLAVVIARLQEEARREEEAVLPPSWRPA